MMRSAARLAARAYSTSEAARATSAKKELAILAEAFQRYDGDASGALDKEELARALSELDIPADEVYVDSLFEQPGAASCKGFHP